MWLELWAILGIVLVFLLVSRWRKTSNSYRKPSKCDGDQQKIIAGIIAEALPVHPSSGWNLEGVSNGVRVFTRHLDALQQYSNVQIFSASLIVDVTLKRALSLVSSVKELSCWSFGLPFSKASQPTLVKQSSATSHVVQFTMMNSPQGALRRTMWRAHSKLAGWITRHTPFLEHFYPVPQKIKTETIERFWHSADGGLCYLFSHPRAPSSLPYSWAIIYFTPLRQTGVCLTTMVMCPSGAPEVRRHVAPIITAQLCALREHVTMKTFKIYSKYHPKHVHNGHSLVVGQNGGHKIEGEKKMPLESKGTAKVMKGPKQVTRGSEHRMIHKEARTPSSFHGSESSFHNSESSLRPKASLHGDVVTSREAALPGDSLSSPPTPQGPQNTLSGPPTPQGPQNALSGPPTPQNALNAQYISMAEQCSNKLVAMTADDGWLVVGTTKDVYVMKKLPGENEPPINSIKGTGTINAPPEFLLRLLLDPAYTTKLDELLKETRVLEKIVPGVALVQLLYKPVWPTSPRDFAVLSICGQVDSSTWISSGTSILDPRIPPEKGYVRADLLGGGYIIRSLPNKPEMSVVTYAACVNLKGSIPAFAVNKIAESQPMCVDHLRHIAEPLYQNMSCQPQKMTLFEEQFPIPQVFPKDVASPLEDGASQPHCESPREGNTHNGSIDSEDHRDGRFETPPLGSEDEHVEGKVRTEEVLPSEEGPDSKEESGPPTNQSQLDSLPLRHSGPNRSWLPTEPSLGQSKDTDAQLLSITPENISYPRHDSGQVDYRTLANQTAARVLEEVFHVSNLDLLDSATYTDQATGGWTFCGYEKDVLLLSKSASESFSSFLGKGIIPLSPDFVFNSLRNPQLRFMYDNMLKELYIVRNIEDGLFILHLHHETTQCFIKQARDFCILVSERSELNKKLLVGVSIESPDCPINPNLHRGKIHCSGWVVEPKRVKGKLCTEVTYLLQVDVGGVPSTLVSLISKRQPLAVAYLRDYLVSTSLEQSGQLHEN